MRKLVILVLIIVMLTFSVVACDKSNSTDDTKPNEVSYNIYNKDPSKAPCIEPNDDKGPGPNANSNIEAKSKSW